MIRRGERRQDQLLFQVKPLNLSFLSGATLVKHICKVIYYFW
jgi:hypothetical protein